MPSPVLTTKLYIPLPRPAIVPRPRLIERLNEGLFGKLTLISAPAGFGKTTLVSQWIAGCRRPVAWLSLDEGDNNPTRFLTYFIAAVRTVAADIGEEVLNVLESPQPPATDLILATLLNEITTIPDQFALVLDDYHVIDSKPVDTILTFLLEHLPPQMHLIIASREDPHLPLPRLRARGQLTELRAADLRFTTSEAAEFLNQVMGLNISAEDIAALESRAEGWIAGLQLAALSMRGSKDIPGFIRAFAGDHRYIVDYLVAEVLQNQPVPMRNFLLRTAILDRMNGSLCDALTADSGGSARLEALQRGNFFVIPLDDKNNWYRYHHLFADVLRMHLMTEQPDQVSALHRRASEWYEHHGSAADAIRHALAAKDFERAAILVELAVPEMRKNRQGATITELGWLKALPDELIRFRPVLSVAYAYALFGGGELEAVEARLRDAEQWLDSTHNVDSNAGIRERPESPAVGMVVVDKEEFRRLPGLIALLRTAQALNRGDLPETVKNARRVLDLAPENDYLMLGGAASTLGLAAWTSGDLEAARRMTADGMENVHRAGYISSAIGGAIVLADVQIAQGHLHEAMTTYERALQWATEPGAPAPGMRGAADMYVGMSTLHCEHNDLVTAEQCLLKSQALGELAGLPQNPYRWRAAMARIREAQGNLDGALDLLDQAERLYVANFSPNVRPIASRKARLLVAQGRLDEALRWTHEQNLSIDDDLSYLREFDHITLARVLLARYLSDPADGSISGGMGLLGRLLQAAEEGRRMGSVIEISALLALAHAALGDLPMALASLERALTLAEPEGYLRLFADEGLPLAVLLHEAAKHAITPNYVRHILAAFGKAEGKTSVTQRLIDPLSERELEVLRLLGTELTGPEIARELMVSLNTMYTHTKSIYNKLGVNNRRMAVRRAEELHLF